MEKNFEQTLNLLQQASDYIHFFVRDNVAQSWILQVIGKFLFFCTIVATLYFLVRFLVNFTFKIFFNKESYPLLSAIYTSKITNSGAQMMVLSMASLFLKSIFWRHPESLFFFERIINFAIVVSLARMMLRLLKGINYYYAIQNDYYRVVALNAISQTLQSIGIFIFTLIGISVVFGIKSSTILGSLGAITAVLVLVFRDTILGFMTGIHVATSKNLKVGDWIAIPKYNLEGNVMDISIITTKILNFDKTISTIPTYDLLSTEIKNNQVMAEGNRRRIKRSIVFNIKSFKFVDDELFARLETINLIADYLQYKKQEINEERKHISNPDDIINGRQLTNIGVFRKYVLSYLKQCEEIDQKELVLVRQLEITPQGMPLEIYCFAVKAAMADFEEIQADIFDHLLASAKIFDLEVMQINQIK